MANLLSEEKLWELPLALWDEVRSRLKRDGLWQGDPQAQKAPACPALN